MRQLCRHIFTAGRHCTQPAIRATLYCRHHQVIKRTLAQLAPTPENYGIYTPLPFVFPEDRAALQLNFMIVAQALNDRRINIQTANAFNRLFYSCQMNLKQGPLAETDPKDPDIVQHVILTPEGEEISIHRGVLDEGEAPLVHGQEFSCTVCEDYRGAPCEQHHVQCKCGMCVEDRDPPSAHSEQNKIELSSRPESASADAVEGSAVSHQTNHPNESPLAENPSVLSVSSVVKEAVPHPSHQIRDQLPASSAQQSEASGLDIKAQQASDQRSAVSDQNRPAARIERHESISRSKRGPRKAIARTASVVESKKPHQLRDGAVRKTIEALGYGTLVRNLSTTCSTS